MKITKLYEKVTVAYKVPYGPKLRNKMHFASAEDMREIFYDLINIGMFWDVEFNACDELLIYAHELNEVELSDLEKWIENYG
jgi:hypothetical protein